MVDGAVQHLAHHWRSSPRSGGPWASARAVASGVAGRGCSRSGWATVRRTRRATVPGERGAASLAASVPAVRDSCRRRDLKKPGRGRPVFALAPLEAHGPHRRV
jgi:hypothetical protein